MRISNAGVAGRRSVIGWNLGAGVSVEMDVFGKLVLLGLVEAPLTLAFFSLAVVTTTTEVGVALPCVIGRATIPYALL